jgi:putative chitinase
MSTTDYRDLLDPLRGSIPDKIIAELPRFMNLYQINTKLRLAHFLAQCAQESGGFARVVESMNYGVEGLLETFGDRIPSEAFARSIARDPVAIGNFVYANINGNGDVASGDGYRFRGRGYIQLSQRNNYAAFNRVVSDDVVSNPDLVATDKYALWVSAWFWDTNRLNPIADRGPGDQIVSDVTRIVNGPARDALVKRQQFFEDFYNQLSGVSSRPTQQLPPTILFASPDLGFGDYFLRIYRNPSVQGMLNRSSLSNSDVFGIIESPRREGERSLSDRIRELFGNNKIIASDDQLEGELDLLDFIRTKVAITETEIRNITGTVRSFSPTEQRILISNGLIEFFPDRMRENMVRNSKEGGVNPNYSHAWRSPAKLAITADITIPGASGFRIGQIFWVDRTYENYKRYGAFQLFGLTETIDLGGWKTSLYARFNALTQRSVQTLVQSHDGLKITDSP